MSSNLTYSTVYVESVGIFHKIVALVSVGSIPIVHQKLGSNIKLLPIYRTVSWRNRLTLLILNQMITGSNLA